VKTAVTGVRRVRAWLARAAWLGGLIGAALLMLSPPGSRLQADEKAPVPAVAAACAACHPGPTGSWAASLHRRTVGAPQVPPDRQGCAACHRGAADHLADLSDESKRPSLKNLSGDQIAAICQSCHRGGKQTLWPMSAHARTRDACLTCHDPHQGKGEAMLKAPEPELCQQCHPGEVAEENLPSHHPIPEGKMVCTDCHNVHGEQRGTLSEASNGEMCYRCHAEKQGPFLNEHPPVTETDAERFTDGEDASRLIGSPNDGRLLSGVLSYSLRNNLLLSGLYTKRDDSYEVSVPTLGVFRTAEVETKTRGAQLVHTEGRGQLSAGYYRQDGDTRSNVTYGIEDFPVPVPFPPIESQAAFHYRATIQTLDGSLWATSRLRLFGRYARTATNGKETLYDLGDYLDLNPDLNGVAMILNPFDIRVLDRWVGVGYLVDRDTEVVLSHQRRSWSDQASISHDGAYGLWRAGLRRQF